MSNLPSLINGDFFSSTVLPVYAGARSNPFDGFCGYNFKAANTTRLRASIANVLAGSASGEWAFIGDSTQITSTTSGGAGQGIDSWPYYLRTLQSAIPQASCIDGNIRALIGVSAGEPRVVAAGSGWSGAFGTAIYGNTVNDTLTLTVGWNGTSSSILYYDSADGSQFTVSVNGAVSGAGFTTVTQSGPAGWKRVNLAGFAAANNVQVKQTVAGTFGVLIATMSLTLPNCLLFHNVAQEATKASGSGSLSWSDNTYYNPGGAYITPHLIGLTKTDPDVLFIELGINDLNGGTATQAQAIAAIQNIATQYPNTDIILCASQAFAPAYFSDQTWTNYVNALYTLADTLNVPLLDFRNLSGNYANSVAKGYTVDGAGHFLPFANAMIARSAAKELFNV